MNSAPPPSAPLRSLRSARAAAPLACEYTKASCALHRLRSGRSVTLRLRAGAIRPRPATVQHETSGCYTTGCLSAALRSACLGGCTAAGFCPIVPLYAAAGPPQDCAPLRAAALRKGDVKPARRHRRPSRAPLPCPAPRPAARRSLEAKRWAAWLCDKAPLRVHSGSSIQRSLRGGILARSTLTSGAHRISASLSPGARQGVTSPRHPPAGARPPTR